MSKIIVLDTSFLLELFQVPMDSIAGLQSEAIALMSEAIEKSYDLYCTVGVLYETANHIVDIKNAKAQRELAKEFADMVKMAWEEQTPFVIVPGACSPEMVSELSKLPELCATYQNTIRQGLSLVDCTIIDLALRLKENYAGRSRRWQAHVWTKHGELKSLEPDSFENEFF